MCFTSYSDIHIYDNSVLLLDSIFGVSMDNEKQELSIEETLKLLANLHRIPEEVAQITIIPTPALYQQAIEQIRHLRQTITHEQALRDQLHKQLENPTKRNTLP